jgi:LuxR family maltose regulon positive regulatory protein
MSARDQGPGFDLLASKLLRPLVRSGTVSRSAVIERLAQGDSRPIVSVVAPPGYGKTIVLSQWAERNGRTFAWVSVDKGDNDPKVLLTYIAEALDAVEPIGERVFGALASPHSSVPGSVVPRLGSAFLSMTTPVALVLDDVQVSGSSPLTGSQFSGVSAPPPLRFVDRMSPGRGPYLLPCRRSLKVR